MLKFRKQISFLIAAVMTVCLSVGILLLVPHKTANAATYYISAEGDRGDQPAGTTYIDISNALNVENGVLTGFKGKKISGVVVTYDDITIEGTTIKIKTILDNPFYLKVPASLGVTSIQAGAFNATNIVSLDLSETSITAIEGETGYTDYPGSTQTYPYQGGSGTIYRGGAFSHCTLLQEVKLPKTSLTTIGKAAFYNTNLTSIEIPASVTSIRMGAFAYCTSLDTVTFGENSKLAYFDNGLFYGDSLLRHIDIPSSVKTIGTAVFNGCAKLTRLDLSNVQCVAYGSASDSSSGTAPFYGMNRLAEVHLPATIKLRATGSTVSSLNNIDSPNHSTWGSAIATSTEYTARLSTYSDKNTLGGLFYGGYNKNGNNASADNYNSGGFNFGNALFNVYYGTGASQKGQSNYVEINKFVFVKNTGWQTGTLASSKARNYNNPDGNLRTQGFNLSFVNDEWYMVDYGGTGNRDADRPLEYPTKAEFAEATGLSLANATYSIAPRVFGDMTMHMLNAKISDAVKIIGNEAFAYSSLNVIDMSDATSLTHVGSGYLRAVPSPIIYLPDRQKADNASGSDTEKCVHIGMFYNNNSAGESWIAPQMVVAPNQAAYNRIKESNWSHYNTAEELTYLIPVNLHYDGADGGYVSQKRMYNKDYTYTQLSNNKWAYDTSITELPAQKGYSKSIWYKDNGYTEAQKISDLNELNNSLTEFVASIDLYARDIKKPNGSYAGADEVTSPTLTYTFDGELYSVDELNELCSALGVEDAYSVDYGYHTVVYELRNSGEYSEIDNIQNVGEYRVTITLQEPFGTWSSPYYINVIVEQKEIELSSGATAASSNNRLDYLHFTDLGNGPIVVEDDEPKVVTEGASGSLPAYNSVTNNTGSLITLSLSRATDAAYSISSLLGHRESEPHEYTASVTLAIDDVNYKFTLSESGAKILEEYYGITVSLIAGGGAAQITKIWYIVGANNRFINHGTTEAYSVVKSGSAVEGTENTLVFGTTVLKSTTDASTQYTVNIPDVERKPTENAVTFTLQIRNSYLNNNQYSYVYANGETFIEFTGTAGTVNTIPVSRLGYYINSSMPAGDYILTLYAPAVDESVDGKPYCSQLEVRREFVVINADLDKNAISKDVVKSVTTELKDVKVGGSDELSPKFVLEYNKNKVQFYDTDTDAQIVSYLNTLKGTGTAGTGVWSESKYNDCYGNLVITFNLDRMRSNTYYAEDSDALAVLDSSRKPISPETYTVYYQITAKNYNSLVDVNDDTERRKFVYTVVIYGYADYTATVEDTIYYTGQSMYPAYENSPLYTILYDENDNCVNAGGHKFELVLNDPTHYRWKDGTTGNKTVTFTISPAKNRWLSFPAIEGWEYDGEPNAAPLAVALYGEVTFTFYKENGEKIEMDDLVNAGSYIMRAEVETGENSNWESIFEDISFTVRKKVVTAPTLAPVEYNGKKQYAKIDGDYYGDYYTVIGNDGFTDVDNYPITIIIDDNHAWPSDTPGVEEGNKLTLIFAITNIQNRFEAPFAVTGWTWNSYNDDEAIVFNAKPKVYTHITEDENIWASAVKWFIYDKVEATGEALISFNLDKDGKVSDKEVLDKLNALLAGTYYARATIDGDAKGNLDAFTDVTQFVVTERVNTWTATPAMFSWAYNSFESSFLSAGVPVAGTVKYTVCSDEACERVVGNLKDFTFNSEGELSEEVVNELKGLITGDYYLLAVVDKVTGQYDGLRLGGRGTSFQVTEADNDWVTAPAISSWVLGEWKPQYNTPEAEALFGDVELTITKDGVTYYRATWVKGAENPTVQENVFKENALEGIPVGAYTLTAKASGIANRYKSIEKDVTFEIYSSGDKMPPNSWSISPTIESWTAGDEPNEPYGVSLREVGNDVYHATYYERFKNEETGKFDTKPLDGVPSQPGDYLVIYEAYVYGHRDYLKAELTFSIYPRINRWTKTPAIKDWFMNETPSDPVAETSETGTKDITYLYKAKDASDDAYTDVKPTTAGTYIMKVTATAAHCEDLIERVEFRIMLAANKWVKDPILDGWSEEFSPNEPDAVAEHGKVVYTYWTTKYNAEANRYERDTLIKDGDKDGKPTAEGTYIMVATAEADGYDTLEAEVVFTIEPAWDMTLMVIDMVLAIVAVIATVVVIAIVIRRKNKC